MRHVRLLCLIPLMAGCYLSHGRDVPGRGDGGYHRVDAAAPARDAGTVARDAGTTLTFIDGAALPDDEPDVMPGERPSDDPSASGWMDPPPTGSGRCCTVGEPVGLDDPLRQASPPLVAWDGREWGVAWTDMSWPTFSADPHRALFRRLNGDALPSTEPRVVTGIGTQLMAMAYGNSRFALVTSDGSNHDEAYRGLLAVVDRDGALRAAEPLTAGESGVAIARDQATHGWAVVTMAPDVEGDGITQDALVVYDESLAELARTDLGAARAGAAHSAVVSLKSLVVVASGLRSTTLRTFAATSLAPLGATEMGVLGDELVGTRLRDYAVFAGRSFGGSALQTIVWDPFNGRVVAGPTDIAHTTSGQGIGLAANDIGGTMGLCYPTGGSPWRDADGLMFVLLGPDGTPLGEPVQVASGFRYVASCAVGASGPNAYTVLWWAAGGEAPAHHSILAARISVRR